MLSRKKLEQHTHQVRCTRCNFRLFFEAQEPFDLWIMQELHLDDYYQEPFTCGSCPDYMVIEEAQDRPYVRHFQHTLSYQIDIIEENDRYIALIPFLRSIRVEGDDFATVCRGALRAIDDYHMTAGEQRYSS